jgi:hypothetical protein
MRRQWFAALVAVPLLLLGLAACGGSGNGSAGAASDTSSEDPQEQAVKWAQCMREHGVDVEDPQADDNGRVRLDMRGRAADQDKVDAAMDACKEYLPANDKLEDLQDDPEFQEAQLRWAQCMRDHGVDVEDPSSGEGGIRIQGDKQDEDKVEAAVEACDPILRDFMPDNTSSGSAEG